MPSYSLLHTLVKLQLLVLLLNQNVSCSDAFSWFGRFSSERSNHTITRKSSAASNKRNMAMSQSIGDSGDKTCSKLGQEQQLRRSVQVLKASLPGEPTQFDTGCVAYPVILPPTEESDNKWQCYYYGNPGKWNFDQMAFLPSGWCGLAESNDGIHWTKVPGSLQGGSILAPSNNKDDWDAVQVGVGDVVRVAPGELHMYYFGASTEEVSFGPRGAISGFRMRIGRAKSLDNGRTWEKLGMVLDYDESEGVFASWPRIILPENKSNPWKMLYHAYNGEIWRVFEAESTDQGETWKRTRVVLEGGAKDTDFDCKGIGTRAVTRWRGGLLMAFEGVNNSLFHQIGFAFCEDADGNGPWKKLESGNPILQPGRAPLGEWTKLVVGTPEIISMEDGSLRIYHCAKRDNEDKHAIGLLISDSGDVDVKSWRAPTEEELVA